jgi:MbtH protein
MAFNSKPLHLKWTGCEMDELHTLFRCRESCRAVKNDLRELTQESENMIEEQEDRRSYKVVINDEEQYSIWFAERDNPLGWHDGGKRGTKKECLDWISEVWTDMRPLTLRRQMDPDAAARKASREQGIQE